MYKRQSDHMATFTYADRPGVIGQVGQLLGAAGINIGAMQVARNDSGDLALMILNADSALAQEVAAQVAAAVGAEHFAVIDL